MKIEISNCGTGFDVVQSPANSDYCKYIEDALTIIARALGYDIHIDYCEKAN